MSPTQITSVSTLALPDLTNTAQGLLLAAVPEFLGSLAAALFVAVATWGFHRLRRRFYQWCGRDKR